MSKDYSVYKYSSYIKRILILCFLPLIVVLISLLTMEEGEPYSWGLTVVAIGACAIMVLFLIYARRTVLNSLIMSDLDLRTVYELDKRKNNELHNLKLLINVYFYDGDFENMISCADQILNLNSSPLDIAMATGHKITALFLLNREEDALNLIEKQKELFSSQNNSSQNPKDNIYCEFIESYINGNYEAAIEAIKKAFNTKNFEISNHIKVKTYYLMRMAYLKLNDKKHVETCAKELLSADKERRTFFTKNL